MPDYGVFGGVLRSELPFPELRALPGASRAPDWTLVRGAPAPLAGAETVGMHRYAGDVEVTLRQAGDVWRIAVSDLGDFDVEPATRDGVRVTWRPSAGAREAWVRFDVLGRVLPIALHRAGALVVHGSSVALDDDAAIAFVAPKGHGKSTLALALAQRGGRLLSDDATVLRPDVVGMLALPGVHAVRLWPDSADALDARAYGEPGALGRKLVVHDVPDALRSERPVPLRAVYVIASPDGAAGAPSAERTRLGGVAGAVALVRHATAGGLLGGPEAPRVLARAADVARRVPVYELRVARDWSRLEQVVARIRGWHAIGAPASANVA